VNGDLHFRRDVLPHLTVERVYGNLRWTSRRGRYWHAQCPLHDDRDPKSRRFSVDTRTLGYRCFSCGRSGDVLKWLSGGGQVTAETFREAERLAGIHRARRQSPKPPKPPRPAGRLPATHKAKSVKPDPKAAALWSSTLPADGTPAGRYLEQRLAWPPLNEWPLPRTVRWIAAEGVRRMLGWPEKSLPRGEWAGCIAFGLSVPGKCAVRAVKLEALAKDGRQTPDTEGKRWRRNVGPTGRLRFVACDLPGGCLHLAEGEVTALALAVRCRVRGQGMAASCSGTSGMTATVCLDPAGRPVRIHCDRDHAGRVAAVRLARTLRSAGRTAMYVGLNERKTDGFDAADELAEDVRERLAIRSEGGLSDPEALIGAWTDALAMVQDRQVAP